MAEKKDITRPRRPAAKTRKVEIQESAKAAKPAAQEGIMKVKDIMTAEPRVCAPDTNLAAAAALMLDADCGILPVVDDGKLVGVVTDRDLYVALATRDERASRVAIRDVIQSRAVTCGPEDDVHTVLATMKQARVRRLPVEGFGGTVLGIVSMNDVVRAARPQGPVGEAEVVEALQAICAPHHPIPHVVAA